VACTPSDVWPTALPSASPHQEGLGRALEATCRRSPIRADVDIDGIGRYPPGLEAATYFSWIEALQNAAKYAGPGAEAHVKLHEKEWGPSL